MRSLSRIAGSFAIVVIAYWLYALMAVPWIEPSAAEPSQVAGGGNDPASAEDAGDRQRKSLVGLFPEDAWELKNPKILESDRAKLLLQEYRNLGDGQVEIKPCTIVFPYDGPADDEAQRKRQTVILEAPGGAILQFDQALDLARAKVGRLVGGLLRGDVTIRSDWKRLGPDDDLLIVTRDIQLTETTISTVNPVDFRWGRHFGRGSDMIIRLLAGRNRPGSEATGPNIAGIASFEMQHVERLHIDAGQSPSTTDGTQVEIQCRGPFLFDVVHHVATFRDSVDVQKLNRTGPSDQILCDLLSLFFAEKKPTPGSSANAGGQDARAPDAGGQDSRASAEDDSDATDGSPDLVAERFEARGNPVVVTAPSRQVVARGPRIEYNMLAKTVSLDGGQEVFLQQGPNEIHAQSLWYQAVEEGRLGRVVAVGPGWLRGQMADRADQQLTATWRDQLRVAPDAELHKISLTGGAELSSPGMGRLLAREISFWLSETPAAGKGEAGTMKPAKMLARKEVRLDSPQLSGQVEELELAFDEAGQRSVASETPHDCVRGGGGAADLTSPPAVSQSPSQQHPSQHFEIVGRSLHARILLGGQEAALSNLLIEDGVRFTESKTTQPGERPLLVSGDRLEVTDAGQRAVVSVTGRPARFEARGLGLTGTNINLDRGANSVWIKGAGQMDMPLAGAMPGAVQNQAATTPGVLTIDWRDGMNFNGGTATFSGSVVATGPQQRLDTSKMEVRLDRPVRFSDTKMQEPPRVEEIHCSEGVEMQNRTFDAQRQLVSIDRIKVADLGINVLTGALTGGRGKLNSVRVGSDAGFGRAAVPVSSRGQDVRAPGNQLYCLHIEFQGSLTGNLLYRQLTFHDQVKTAYAPVEGWDATLATDNPDQLGPRGVTLRCDRLSVVEMMLPIGGRKGIELEALGNAKVENVTFTARGNRIAYAEAKDQLILEGDGRNNAELWRQAQVGDPASKAAARKIWYWPKTNRLKIDDAQSVEIGQLPGGGR